jgi:DNA-binding helix-hairpin-helix protein with protein kinase domain
MSSTNYYIDRSPVTLAQKLGQGGEGVVFSIQGSDELAVKLYHSGAREERRQKIESMVSQRLADQSSLVSFPYKLVTDRSGEFHGFAMRKFAGAKPLHELYAPGSRKDAFPDASFQFLVHASINIAKAFASIHASGCIIGDVNHSGILVSNRAIASIIDADSFQFSSGKKKYFCSVGVPEYTPPELQGKTLRNLERNTNHDNFGLAVIIFQMLFMGRHPFAGRPKYGDTPIEKAITEFRFAYSKLRRTDLVPPPGIYGLSEMPNFLASAFEMAFSPEGVRKRPTAKEWISELSAYEKSLIRCAGNNRHHYHRELNECHLCQMENSLGIHLFGYGDHAVHKKWVFDHSSIDKLIKSIESTKLPERRSIVPQFTVKSLSPSSAVKQARSATNEKKFLGAGLLAGALLGFLTAPGAAIIWIVLALWGGVSLGGAAGSVKEQLVRSYASAAADYDSGINEWFSRIGLAEVESARSHLLNSIASYRGLDKERQSKISQYHSNRKKYQLEAFLRQHKICRASINGIGPAKVAALESWGIESAADATYSRVSSVPGFGPVFSTRVDNWRKSIERKFVFNPNKDSADKKALQLIDDDFANREARLKSKITGGAKDLGVAIEKVNLRLKQKDAKLSQLFLAKAQAENDLKVMGYDVPSLQSGIDYEPVASQNIYTSPKNVRPPVTVHGGGASSGRASTVQHASSQPQKVSGGAAPACPQCGSRMVKRTARKGKYSGRDFWGCSKYPSCKAIVNI